MQHYSFFGNLPHYSLFVFLTSYEVAVNPAFELFIFLKNHHDLNTEKHSVTHLIEIIEMATLVRWVFRPQPEPLFVYMCFICSSEHKSLISRSLKSRGETLKPTDLKTKATSSKSQTLFLLSP